MENSIAENVTNEQIQAIHNYVGEVKRDKEVEIQYMKSWEYEEMIREEATAQGLAAGREKGLAEGRKERSLEIARQLLDVLDISTIAEKTGLSEEEVNQLKKDL